MKADSKPAVRWTTDRDGDHKLYIDGTYAGMVCPHHLPDYALAVWDWGDGQWAEATVEEAKAHLERVRLRDHAGGRLRGGQA